MPGNKKHDLLKQFIMKILAKEAWLLEIPEVFADHSDSSIV